MPALHRSAGGGAGDPLTLTLPRRIAVAAFLGMAGGAVEVALLAVRTFLLHRWLLVGWSIVWTTPLVYALLGVTLAVLSEAVPAERRLPVTAGAVLFVVSFGAFFTFEPWIAKTAIILLAMGVTWRLTILVSRHAGALRLSIRGLIVMATAIAAAGIVVAIAQDARQRRAEATTPAPSGRHPNVLLVILDTVRDLDLSAYGYARATTPNLQAFAAHGIRFARAVAPAPWTLPSHVAVFTGRMPHELSAGWWRPLDDRMPTLAEDFRRAGYRTGGFVGNTGMASHETGLARGFSRYDDHLLGVMRALASTNASVLLTNKLVRRVTGHWETYNRNGADEIVPRALGWIDERPGRPFFAFVNLFDAHGPYEVPARERAFEHRPGPGFFTRLANHGHLLKPNLQLDGDTVALIDAYDDALRIADRGVGRLLEGLRQRGLDSTTIVVVTADHGEEFAEHGFWEHGWTQHRQAVYVPLVIRPAAWDGARVVPGPVSLVNLAATIEALAGTTGQVGGRSLADSWTTAAWVDTVLTESTEPGRKPAITRWGQSAAAGSLHLVRDWEGTERLYDLDRDPEERHDLATDTAYGHARAALHDVLARERAGFR